MPIYTWKHKETGEKVDVLRNHKDYEIPPQADETELDPDTPEKWERVLQPFRLTKGWGWGGGKGQW